jgi:hypothetical protein
MTGPTCWLHRINRYIPQHLVAAFTRQCQNQRPLNLPAKLQRLSIRSRIERLSIRTIAATQRLLE